MLKCGVLFVFKSLPTFGLFMSLCCPPRFTPLWPILSELKIQFENFSEICPPTPLLLRIICLFEVVVCMLECDFLLAFKPLPALWPIYEPLLSTNDCELKIRFQNFSEFFPLFLKLHWVIRLTWKLLIVSFKNPSNYFF
jgi:hypothetical protein